MHYLMRNHSHTHVHTTREQPCIVDSSQPSDLYFFIVLLLLSCSGATGSVWKSQSANIARLHSAKASAWEQQSDREREWESFVLSGNKMACIGIGILSMLLTPRPFQFFLLHQFISHFVCITLYTISPGQWDILFDNSKPKHYAVSELCLYTMFFSLTQWDNWVHWSKAAYYFLN